MSIEYFNYENFKDFENQELNKLKKPTNLVDNSFYLSKARNEIALNAIVKVAFKTIAVEKNNNLDNLLYQIIKLESELEKISQRAEELNLVLTNLKENLAKIESRLNKSTDESFFNLRLGTIIYIYIVYTFILCICNLVIT